MHRHLQCSIADGTYRYCNNRQCTYIKKNVFEQAAGGIRHLRLAIDDSCNLRCPSCRKNLIFHKEGSAHRLGIRLADRINEWLYDHDGPIQVHIGSDGDPFASHVYRHFMEQTPERDNIKYSILTNALMFKEFHTRVPYVMQNLNELGVSIDGASKDTYEKLRLGGRWDKINENLASIADAKRRHGFKFILYFVVQKDNHHEMDDMLALGERYGADRVNFSLIEDWGVLPDFKSKLPPLEDPEFKEMLERCTRSELGNTWVHR